MILSPFSEASNLLDQSIGTIKQTYLQNKHQNPSNDTFFLGGTKSCFLGRLHANNYFVSAIIYAKIQNIIELGSIMYVKEKMARQYHFWIERYHMHNIGKNQLCKFLR